MDTHITVLRFEIQSLTQDKHVVPPLQRLKTDTWGAVKLHPPTDLQDLQSALSHDLRAVYFTIEGVNDTLASREMHRVNNQGMSNYISSLKLYDETMLAVIEQLAPRIRDVLDKMR